MTVYGGIEWTENALTSLSSYPGVLNVMDADITPTRSVAVGTGQLHFYAVATADVAAQVGAVRNTDHRLVQVGRVNLSNDVRSAEWVVEGHAGAASVAAMMTNLRLDMAAVLQYRTLLKTNVEQLKVLHAGHRIFISPDSTNLRLPGPLGIFEYAPHATNSTGAAQLTVQYANVETITRICRLNASKYLTGRKVDLGDDPALAAGTLSWTQWARYSTLAGQNSFATAGQLLGSLVELAQPVTAGGVTLSAAQVGLVMLMVLNDAMACCMRRYAAPIGQSADKNVQRFFPKSTRHCYVNAVCQADVPQAALTALQGQINGVAADIAQLEWDTCDPGALDAARTVAALDAQGPLQAVALAALLDAHTRAAAGRATTAAEQASIKNAVLGVNGATLANHIQAAALAYADRSQNAAAHFANGNGRVVTSLAFSPVAGGAGVHGAVYEFRDREVALSITDPTALHQAMTTLLTAS